MLAERELKQKFQHGAFLTTETLYLEGVKILDKYGLKRPYRPYTIKWLEAYGISAKQERRLTNANGIANINRVIHF